jgi:hypothetical protein
MTQSLPQQLTSKCWSLIALEDSPQQLRIFHEMNWRWKINYISNNSFLCSPSTTKAFPTSPAIPINENNMKTVFDTVHSSSWSNNMVSLPNRNECVMLLHTSPNILHSIVAQHDEYYFTLLLNFRQ